MLSAIFVFLFFDLSQCLLFFMDKSLSSNKPASVIRKEAG